MQPDDELEDALMFESVLRERGWTQAGRAQAENERLKQGYDRLVWQAEATAQTLDDVRAELARVKAAARAFLGMSTNVTRAALAEAVKEDA